MTPTRSELLGERTVAAVLDILNPATQLPVHLREPHPNCLGNYVDLDIDMTAFGTPAVRETVDPEPDFDTYADQSWAEGSEPCS